MRGVGVGGVTRIWMEELLKLHRMRQPFIGAEASPMSCMCSSKLVFPVVTVHAET